MALYRKSGTAAEIVGRSSRRASAPAPVTGLWRCVAGAPVLVADWSGPQEPPPAPTGPTFVASAASPQGWSSASSVPAISAVQAGDILIAFAAGNFQADTVTPPAGLTWTAITSTNAVGGGRAHLLAAVATGPLGVTSWGWPAAHNHGVGIVAYRGAAAPTTGAAALASAATTATAPSRTTTKADAVLLCTGYHSSNGTTAAFPGSMTARLNTATATPGMVIAAEARPTPGATGARTYTVTPGNTTLFVASVALEPA